MKRLKRRIKSLNGMAFLTCRACIILLGLIASVIFQASLAQGAATEELSVTDESGRTLSPFGGAFSITQAGEYTLSGSYTGQILIDISKDESVVLHMAGAMIDNANGPAIYVMSGGELTLMLDEGTQNRISDGIDYPLDEEGADAALYSKADVTISGGGSLLVEGHFHHGILSKDDLIIDGGVITINAASDGLRGRDGVTVRGGTIDITAGGDGIQSNNDEDDSRGFVRLAGGEVFISAESDGVQAVTELTVSDGKLHITCHGSDSETSRKGLKSNGNLTISGGEIEIDSEDDALHAGGDTLVSGGTVALSTRDDGAHADGTLTIAGGTLRILNSHEGLEGKDVLISGGEIDIRSSDDGINAAGGSDEETNDRDQNWRSRFAPGDNSIRFTGGKTTVNADGDGVDSNGEIHFEDGEVYVFGPVSDWNGALDSGSNMEISGGVLMALGSSGMASKPENAGQTSSLVFTGSEMEGGHEITVQNSNGDTLLSFTPDKRWSSIVLSHPQIVENEMYVILMQGEKLASFKGGEGQSRGWW